MKVLIIEDEHKIANSVRKGLVQEGIISDVAYDGESGYDLASSEPYDVIVLDLLLPGMSGLQICKKLRDEKIHTPILILTAKGQLEDKVEGLNAGADDYMVKPFAFSELLARIKALGRRPKQTVNSVLKTGDLVMDTTEFRVERGGKEIRLSKKEFSLLEYLMHHAGKVVSKDQLIGNVWSYESEILPNTIEVFIRYLRNKIDKPFKDKKPLIQTIRGFGYKIG